MNKSGLSDIVVTLIIVLLSMVAIGVVWAVVNNLLQSGTEQTEQGFGSLFINLEIEKVQVERNLTSVNLKRNSGEGNVSGLIFLISDGENTKSITREIQINPLEEKIFTFSSVELSGLNYVKEVSVAAVLDGKVGNVIDTFEMPEIGGDNQWWEIEPSTINILVIDNSSGTPSWVSQMQSLGYNVVIRDSINSIDSLQSYISSLPENDKPDIIACIRTGWACTKASLFNSLYDSGYKIFTNGNDNSPAIKIISTTQYVAYYSRNTTAIYPATDNCAKPLTYNWTSSAGSGGDSRMGVLTISSSACLIAKDTLASPTFIEAAYMEGAGRWFHIQAHSSMNNNFLDNVLKYLAR